MSGEGDSTDISLCMRLRKPATLVLLLPIAAVGFLSESALARTSSTGLWEEEPGRGLTLDGLQPARAGGVCDPGHDGHFEIRAQDGQLLGCTHGPDPAPPGESLTSPTTAALRSEGAAGAGSVPCIGDGVSGYRVQAIYAHPADMTSRYGSVLETIRGYAGTNVDEVFAASAAETGGTRRVRFVTETGGSACHVDVDEVRLSTTGDDSFSNTIAELRKLGYTRSDRKYLVWMDTPAGRSSVYCGIGQLYNDETDAVSNMNNGNASVQGMFARVDAGCWGSAGTPVEAHELMHNLGGVQRGAPHSTGRFPSPAGGHCTDDNDVMCYDDDGSGPATVTVVCPSSVAQRRFDCGDDDYFSTAPVSGSYLDTHWNAADSRFLDTTVSAPPANDAVAGAQELVESSEEDGGLRLSPSRKRVPPGTRIRLTASSPSCGPGGDVELVAGDRLWARNLSERCTAVFRSRITRRMIFRAFVYDQVGRLVGRSKPISVAVRRS
jgi:hypothetical protein